MDASIPLTEAALGLSKWGSVSFPMPMPPDIILPPPTFTIPGNVSK